MSSVRDKPSERQYEMTFARPPLILVGASVRSLAQSAQKAGWSVYAADLFGDHDLLASTVRLERIGDVLGPDQAFSTYPTGLACAAKLFPCGPWCYTGALENYPDLIDSIAANRPLAGNSGSTVTRVRDSTQLARAIQDAGLLFPQTHTSPSAVSTDGSFLIKPIASAGGRGIKRWTVQAATDYALRYSSDLESLSDSPHPRHVWQQWIEGDSYSAAFVCSRGTARLFAVSQQLTGLEWCAAATHAYCGSVALPLADVPIQIQRQLNERGSLLAGRFDLIGLVGVDCVINSKQELVIIEINPRPTASMELWERSTGGSLATTHLRACGFSTPPPAAMSEGLRQRAATMPQIWSKSILFARHDCEITVGLFDRLLRLGQQWADGDWPPLADLPRPAQVIPAGAPLLTLFAREDSCTAAIETLTARTQLLEEVFGNADGRVNQPFSLPQPDAFPLPAKNTA